MSGILGFAVARPRAINVDQLQHALWSLEQRRRDDRRILLFNYSEGRSLLVDASSGSLHSSLRDSPAENHLASAMLAGDHSLEEDCPSKRSPSLESAESRIFLTCDGIIDNGPELARELQQSGYSNLLGSQCELLLVAYARWGPDCLARVRGSFAFAMLDFRRRCLILARDTFGTRPLYYSCPHGTGLFFASRIDSILRLASIVPRVNRTSLYRYLAQNMMDHTPATFFKGISQVPPGHYIEAPLQKPAEILVTPYRRVVPAQTKLSFEEAAQRLRDLVVDSVTSQAGVQTPHKSLGAAHSGGFDSSFVVAAYERAHPDTELQLYTCIPLVKNGTFSRSEEEWAHLAASGFRSPINKVKVRAECLPEEFASLVCLQEEPFSSPVVFAQLQLFRAAHENGVQKMLSGQGGDTLFATDADSLLRAMIAHLRRGRWGTAATLLKLGTQPPLGGLRRLVRAAARAVTPRSLQMRATKLAQPPRPDWLKKEWFEFESIDPITDSNLPVLRFEDRNSVACSILNRMPLLTVELQDFVRSLPAEYLVTANQPLKSIECAALRGLVPDALLARRERSGFPVPVREWLDELAPWVEMNMTEIAQLPFIEAHRVRHIWEAVRWQNASVSSAFLVWRWVFLAGWLRYLKVCVD